MPTLYKSVQQKNEAKLYEKFPIILTSGRLVEYEGGGEETRSNPWLAELQQENFVELNPKAAADRGIRNGEYVIVSTPTGARIKVRALVTPRVANTAFILLLRLVAGQGYERVLSGRCDAYRAR
jgi:formate dehydrogenase major subunit